MPTVPIAAVQEGSILSQPAYSPAGTLLAPAGTVLTEVHLKMLVARGVREVELAATGPAGGQPVQAVQQAQVVQRLDPRQMQAVSALLEERFALVTPLHPFLREVRRVAEEILIQRMRAGEAGGAAKQ